MSEASSRHDQSHPAQAALVQVLERVEALHAERRANPRRAAALERIARWQADRLRGTYADLMAQARYADAIAFFQTDLYGNADFAQRDADLTRVVPVMMRMLPARVIATVVQAMELNALSQELDRTLLAQLPREDGGFTAAEYCHAYRRMGSRPARERQIGLIGEIGAALDSYVKKPLIQTALVMMRRPARLAGLQVLHDFLERGFLAFRKMQGADEFLATIDGRERELMNALFAGEPVILPVCGDPSIAAEPSPAARTPPFAAARGRN
jgi:hypothetical protein